MWGAIISAVAGLASSIFGGIARKRAAKKAKKAAAEQNGWSTASNVISSVADAATSIGSMINSKNAIANQNSWNSQQAEIAREWNLDVDSTKYQRTVQDMQAAGVNPALAIDGHLSTQAASNAQAVQTESGLQSIVQLAKLAGDLKYRDQELRQEKELKSRELDIAQQNANTNANVGGATAENQRQQAEATRIANKYADEKARLTNDFLRHQIDYEKYLAEMARIDSEIKAATKDTEIAIRAQELSNMQTMQSVYLAQVKELNARTSKELSEKEYIDSNKELLGLVKTSKEMENTYDAYCLENNLPADQPLIVMTYRQADMNQQYWSSKGDYKQAAAFADVKNKIRAMTNKVASGKMTDAELTQFWVSQGRGLVGDVAKTVGLYVGAKGVTRSSGLKTYPAQNVTLPSVNFDPANIYNYKGR